MKPLAYSSQSSLYFFLGVLSLLMPCFFSTLTSMGVPLTSKHRGKNTLHPFILWYLAAKSMREYPVACPRWRGPEVYLGGLSMLKTGLSDLGSKR